MSNEFFIIKGTFCPKEGIPDGDSVRFKADNNSLFRKLKGIVDIKEDGTVQLRYEGIDAIEKQALQPLANESKEKNLELLRESSQKYRGYILSKQAETNRRPVCFVFSGDIDNKDGEKIVLTETMLEKSVNYKLVASGYSYTLFYETLDEEIQKGLNKAYLKAKQEKLGLHKIDASTLGVKVNSERDLSTIPPIFPKLWRRLKEYLGNHSNLDHFQDFLSKKKEKVSVISANRHHLFLEDIIEVSGNSIRLIYEPNDIVFKPVDV